MCLLFQETNWRLKKLLKKIRIQHFKYDIFEIFLVILCSTRLAIQRDLEKFMAKFILKYGALNKYFQKLADIPFKFGAYPEHEDPL